MALITTEGKNWVVDKLHGVAPLSNALMDYGISGATSTAEAVGNTLANCFTSSPHRTQGTLSQPSANIDRLVWTQAYTSSLNIVEAGRTNASSGTTPGTHVLYGRGLFTAIPVINGDSIEYTFDAVA